MKRGWLGPLFWVAAIYDGLLGLAFLFFWRQVFEWFGVTPVNHPGYVQFPALLLLTFALMFALIAIDPWRNANLIPFGICLKASYAGVVFGYKLSHGIPAMWLPWAWADLGFLACFILAWRAVSRGIRAEGAPHPTEGS